MFVFCFFKPPHFPMPLPKEMVIMLIELLTHFESYLLVHITPAFVHIDTDETSY